MQIHPDHSRRSMSSTRFTAVAAVFLALAAATPLAAQDWKTYKSDEYGFSMNIPEGSTVKEKEWTDGWGGLFAEHDGVKLWGLAKLGSKYSAEEIEQYGVKLTGISEDEWHEIDKGENSNGWTWFRTVKATKGGTAIYGGFGAGAKGSYLLILKTTTADYDANKAEYKKWYDSIKLK